VKIAAAEAHMIELKQYRDKWIAEKLDDFIGFYTREFFCLDNFSAFGIRYKRKYYATVEHAYQAGKFFVTDPETAENVRAATSAHHAKNISRENKEKWDPKFDEYKVEFMEKLLRLKLEQHPFVKRKLLETGDYPICEDSPGDTFWGIGRERDGQNMMGKLWMKIRSEIRES